eukprot:TRINITY_DN3099_c1_g1_i2.p1 TRINITY_DN3099_c1_g1~~TRINITY_DN3099_c1_g1_i2.p1  ORF type:complete len:219 (-),score=7.74 TRINITY_DN3099_c1_g1_i2:121-777(-)
MPTLRGRSERQTTRKQRRAVLQTPETPESPAHYSSRVNQQKENERNETAGIWGPSNEDAGPSPCENLPAEESPHISQRERERPVLPHPAVWKRPHRRRAAPPEHIGLVGAKRLTLALTGTYPPPRQVPNLLLSCGIARRKLLHARSAVPLALEVRQGRPAEGPGQGPDTNFDPFTLAPCVCRLPGASRCDTTSVTEPHPHRGSQEELTGPTASVLSPQ